MSFDSIELPVAADPVIRMPAPRAKPLMSRPRIVVPEPKMIKPSAYPVRLTAQLDQGRAAVTRLGKAVDQDGMRDRGQR